MSPNAWIFLGVFVIAVAFFISSCVRRFRLVWLGKAEDRFDSVGRRLWNVILFPLLQRCSINRNYLFGFNHALLFWAFITLLIANTEFLLNGIFPSIALSRLPDGAYFTLAMIFDIASIIALLSVIFAILRRLWFPPKYIAPRSADAFLILSFVAILMIAFFWLNGSEIALDKERAAAYMPVSGFVARAFMGGTSGAALEASAMSFWWIHAIILLAFLNYLPYSKHMHILTSIPNVYFRRLERVNTQPREEFRKGNTYGVSQVNQFTWKGLFDTYSCTECGRCSDMCPATATNKPLNPRLVIHDIKVNLLKNGPGLLAKKAPNLPLIGAHNEGSVEEEVIWECTTCGGCVAVCPVFIEQFPRIIDMRRNLVEMQSKFPQELLAFFDNMEQRSNPWGIAPADRAKWAADIQARTFEAGKTEYLFYVGCAGSFDARSKQVSVATARVLDAAGVSWGILGRDERCCGDSLRRLGNEYVFDSMAQQNIKQFRDKGVTKVITQCPHCFNTLKNDYRQFGADFEVIHHTELINQLIQSEKIKLDGKVDLGNVVFHDSCYLGRYNQVYTAPRQAIASVTGKVPTEMERNHERSFCCGAGGGRMWMEESVGKRINIERVEQVLSKNPKTVCVCCPYCMTMFEDGMKDKKVDESVQVLDIAEIVARALKQG